MRNNSNRDEDGLFTLLYRIVLLILLMLLLAALNTVLEELVYLRRELETLNLLKKEVLPYLEKGRKNGN